MAPDIESFIPVERTEDERTFRFKVGPDHCVGPDDAPFLFGGVTMGAGVAAFLANRRLDRRQFGSLRLWKQQNEAHGERK